MSDSPVSSRTRSKTCKTDSSWNPGETLNATLSARVAELEAENARLKKENTELKKEQDLVLLTFDDMDFKGKKLEAWKEYADDGWGEELMIRREQFEEEYDSDEDSDEED